MFDFVHILTAWQGNQSSDSVQSKGNLQRFVEWPHHWWTAGLSHRSAIKTLSVEGWDRVILEPKSNLLVQLTWSSNIKIKWKKKIQKNMHEQYNKHVLRDVHHIILCYTFQHRGYKVLHIEKYNLLTQIELFKVNHLRKRQESNKFWLVDYLPDPKQRFQNVF